jgi:hypothetical protein
VRVEKSCALCQKYGGAHTTHNTGECHKYEKDGTLKKSFSRKTAIGQKRHGNCKKESANSFALIMDRFSKLEKTVKKAQKTCERRNVATKIATLVIPTQNRIVGTVVL